MEDVELAEYLWTRLHQLGVKSLHGVPGDYNLIALDYVERAGLNWVGNCNELNAGYAADGYARATGKLGAMFTVIGVGELSSINACAGSYAEYIPVVYIVGSPTKAAQKNKLMLHHTLGDGDYDVFADMYRRVTVAQTNLDDPLTAAEEIDRVLRECWIQKRPVYIRLPSCMVNVKLSRSRLENLIDLALPPNDAELENRIIDLVLERLYKAKKPIILSDCCAVRHQVLTETNQLVLKSKIPSFVTPMGKSSVNESCANFCGLYIGSQSRADIREYVESADFILHIGPLSTDVNTAFFSSKLSRSGTVELHSDRVEIGGERYQEMHMRSVLQKLYEALDPSKLELQTPTQSPPPYISESVQLPTPPQTPEVKTLVPKMNREPKSSKTVSVADLIVHDYLWPRMSRWFQPHDIIITENGTANMGILESKLPDHAQIISQTLWGSIGYTLGAAQGAGMAVTDFGTGARTILFIGDGSFQMTCQELSTIIRQNIPIIIFLIANEGYTIERFIHGWEASYNDIAEWDWSGFPKVMTSATSTTPGIGNKLGVHKVATRGELEKLLDDESFGRAGETGLQFVELRMPKEDAPGLLVRIAEGAAKNNKS